MNKRNLISIKLIRKTPQLFSNFSSTIEFAQFPYNLSNCISSLQACALHNNLSKGKEIHSWMLSNGFLNSPLSITSLINMYSKCNQPIHALAVFNATDDDRNVFAWNAIIAGFTVNALSKYAFEFYQKMKQDCTIHPDKFTFPCVIKACSDLAEVDEVRKINGKLFKIGLDSDAYIASSLINFYLKFSFMDEARRLFDELPMREKDVVLWNAMITGYAQIGEFDKALEVFARMVDEGIVPSKFTITGIVSVFAMIGDCNNGRAIHGFVKKFGYESDIVVLNSLIDMYGKCKFIGDAKEIFEEMQERDIFSWNSILSVHEQSGDYYGTLRFFDRMRDSGIQPDTVTVTTVLPACAHLAALMHGREIHGYMIVNGLTKDANNVYMENAVMDMYAKCGCLRDGQLIFDKMRNKDVASWNIMIIGYGMHGYGVEALDMFSWMHEAQVRPDEVTFVGILSACSHAGFVRHGSEILTRMEVDYGVVPTVEHYACVVDMLGRAGHLDKAYELVLSMPIESNPVVWRAFLAACRLHGNAILAEIAAQRVFELEPGHCGSYVLISNVYGSIGRYKDVSDMRQTMRIRNVRKTPGCSWIELKTGMHVFVTGDRTHIESDRIYTELDALIGHLPEYGYMPDISHVY